jgi:hypothetical protein
MGDSQLAGLFCGNSDSVPSVVPPLLDEQDRARDINTAIGREL